MQKKYTKLVNDYEKLTNQIKRKLEMILGLRHKEVSKTKEDALKNSKYKDYADIDLIRKYIPKVIKKFKNKPFKSLDLKEGIENQVKMGVRDSALSKEMKKIAKDKLIKKVKHGVFKAV